MHNGPEWTKQTFALQEGPLMDKCATEGVQLDGIFITFPFINI